MNFPVDKTHDAQESSFLMLRDKKLLKIGNLILDRSLRTFLSARHSRHPRPRGFYSLSPVSGNVLCAHAQWKTSHEHAKSHRALTQEGQAGGVSESQGPGHSWGTAEGWAGGGAEVLGS